VEVKLSLTPISTTITGSVDLEVITGGIYFTNIFFGDAPESTSLSVLYGETNNFSSVEFQEGSGFSQGSIVIGGFAPSGALQSFDLDKLEVIESYSEPVLRDDNLEDFS
jgi:hypothetical protein